MYIQYIHIHYTRVYNAVVTAEEGCVHSAVNAPPHVKKGSRRFGGVDF